MWRRLSRAFDLPPWSHQENSLEKHFGHVEHRNHADQTHEFYHQIQILIGIVLDGLCCDPRRECEENVRNGEPKRYKRCKEVKLIRTVHCKAQNDGHEVKTEHDIQEPKNSIVARLPKV